MRPLDLRPLRGRNPLGLFAALGALDVATRLLPSSEPTLRWSDDVDPFAILEGPDGIDHLVQLCLDDVERWRRSPVLIGPPGADGHPIEVSDLKVSADALGRWFRFVAEDAAPGDMADLRLLSALVAVGGMARGKEESKPTHFHFTAGQQRFLDGARELRDGLTAEHLHQALDGPWVEHEGLKTFGWNAKGERTYALTGRAPGKAPKPGVPGADWLALLGLRFFPVSVEGGRDPELRTTGCSRGWKTGNFVWPLWDRPISATVVASLLAHGSLGTMKSEERAALGVTALLTAPIRRSEQGGYGSFGAPSVE